MVCLWKDKAFLAIMNKDGQYSSNGAPCPTVMNKHCSSGKARLATTFIHLHYVIFQINVEFGNKKSDSLQGLKQYI